MYVLEKIIPKPPGVLQAIARQSLFASCGTTFRYECQLTGRTVHYTRSRKYLCELLPAIIFIIGTQNGSRVEKMLEPDF